MRSKAIVRFEIKLSISPIALGAVFALAFAGTSLATPPVEPLAPPIYAFDAQSPSVDGPDFDSGDFLEVIEGQAELFLPGGNIGIGLPGDELNAISVDYNANLIETFAVLFSVDRMTVGTLPTDPYFVEHGRPYSVMDQAMRGQGAGDQFIIIELFSRGGPGGGTEEPTAGSNLLGRNNYDEGGTDFGATPPTSAKDDAVGEEQDNTNATTGGSGTAPLRSGSGNEGVYFTLSGTSPSLQVLPGGQQSPSGANLCYNSNPQVPGTPTELFAFATDIGLVQSDDIDALIIFDDGVEGTYDNTDQIIFSLAPNSPSLSLLGASPADLLTVTFGSAPAVFFAGELFGLGDLTVDNVDALDIAPATDIVEFGLQHAIRRFLGDWDDDLLIDLVDFSTLFVALSGPRVPVTLQYEVFDFDFDSDVDLRDVRRFQIVFSMIPP